MHNEFLYAGFVISMTYWVSGTILHIMNSSPTKLSKRECQEIEHRQKICNLSYVASALDMKLDI